MTTSKTTGLWRRCTAAALLGLLGLAAGCSTLQTGPTETGINPPVLPGPASADGSIRYDTEDARVAQLWSAAEQARSEQRDEDALRYLVEALEINPQNSLVWSRAAELQLKNSQAALAENYAMKSNSFAGNDVAMLRRNWLIIEHARSVRGDLLGVRSAHKKVQEFQYR